MVFDIDDVAGLVLLVPGVAQCWVQAADEPGAMDVYVRFGMNCSTDRAETLRVWLPMFIADHADPIIKARVAFVDRLTVA